MGTIQSLERGLRILDALAEADADPMRRARGVPIAALAAELDVHKTTALRLVRTLVEAGYATPVEGRQGYRLGPAMRRDAVLSIGTQRFRRAARPFLEELVDRTGECAHAAVPDGDRGARHRRRRDRAAAARRGEQRASRGTPLDVGGQVPPRVRPRRAAGLAARPDVADDHDRRRPRERHLGEVREQGYAFDDEENDAHTRCISAPVFGPDGAAIGCIGIDAPSVRLTAERVARKRHDR